MDNRKKEEIRNRICEMNETKEAITVCTHPNVDTDAVISLWLMRRVLGCGVYSLSMIADRPEMGGCPSDIYVDYTPKQHGTDCVIIDHHIENTEYKSCASLIWDIFKMEKTNPHLRMLVEYADAVDTAQWTRLPAPFKHFTLGALITSLRCQGYDDATIIKYVCDFIDIMEPYMKTLYQSEETAKDIEIITTKRFKIAVLDRETPPAVSGILFDTYNIDFIVYQVKNNIGVIRNANLTEPSLTKLKEYIDEDGWFFHPAGFIACRGSRKHPATTPSKYTIDDIVSLVQTL